MNRTRIAALSLKSALALVSIALAAPALATDATRAEREAARTGRGIGAPYVSNPTQDAKCDCSEVCAHETGAAHGARSRTSPVAAAERVHGHR
jgi:hypothetical protein